jgi:hypothetical protein
MAMKLLPKSQVEASKAQEQKQKIDEGLKLAKRIDNLREVALAEEASLEAFRKKKVKELNDQITTKTSERDQLTEGNKKLRKEREELLRPLTEEWQELAVARDELTEREKGVAKAEAEAGKVARSAELDQKRAKISLTRAESRERLAHECLVDARDAKKEAESTLVIARKGRETWERTRDEAEKSLKRRDIAASARERDIEIKKTNLEKDREELAREWVLLEDRKAAFERRLKHNK